MLADLHPALKLFTDVKIEWWQDSHLTCGEELTAGIVARLDEADFGLLLLSTRFFSRPFIREHELPRFVGPAADKGALPVALSPLPAFGPESDLGGIDQLVVFTQDGKSFGELVGVRRTRFANDLAASVRRRVLGLNGYREL